MSSTAPTTVTVPASKIKSGWLSFPASTATLVTPKTQTK